MSRTTAFVSLCTLAIAACAPAADAPADATDEPAADEPAAVPGPDQVLAQITGLAEPEAVRYDDEHDVYYVSNFNGDGGERDGNGFITLASADGEVLELQFMTGTDDFPMHAPRGMNIEGGLLWVADVDGVHGFNRETGAHAAFHDLSSFEPGFLNDIGVDGSGTLYVTDTGQPRVYAINDGVASIAVEDQALGPANGITWDSREGRFVFAPWHGVTEFAAWTPGPDGGTMAVAGSIDAAFFDGIEPFEGGFLVASQSDSSLYLMTATEATQRLRVAGNPADIGLDTRRNNVAVPYISLNRVDIWSLNR